MAIVDMGITTKSGLKNPPVESTTRNIKSDKTNVPAILKILLFRSPEVIHLEINFVVSSITSRVKERILRMVANSKLFMRIIDRREDEEKVSAMIMNSLI